MQILITGIFLFIGAIVVLSFYKLELSIALYTAYLILVPYLEIWVAGKEFSYNKLNILILFIFIYHFKSKLKTKRSYVTIIPFLFLFGWLLILTIFQSQTPWAYQLEQLYNTFIQSCILGYVIWNLTIYQPKMAEYIKWSLLVAITIAGIYGIYLTQLQGLNPYTSFLASYFDKDFDAAEIYSASEARLSNSTAAKIQSTMIHPMTWALILCMSFVIFVVLYLKEKKNTYLLLIGLISYNLLISGVRTGIAALILGFSYYIIAKRNFKVFFYGLITIAILYILVGYSKDLSNIFISFTDISGSTVNGSSIEMRLEQLNGVFVEMQDNFLFGKGYSWNIYYMTKFGDHPVILAFESLLFVVLCNSGIIGAIIWIIFFYMLYRLNRIVLKELDDILLMDVFMIVYLSYTIGTGDYGYMKFFTFFYLFLLGYLSRLEKTNLNKILFAINERKN